MQRNKYCDWNDFNIWITRNKTKSSCVDNKQQKNKEVSAVSLHVTLYIKFLKNILSVVMVVL